MVDKNGSRASRGNLMRVLNQVLEAQHETNKILRQVLAKLSETGKVDNTFHIEKSEEAPTQKRGASKNYINKNV